MNHRRKRKKGLVLSGGGADSAYAVGVLKALSSGQSPVTGGRPLDPEVITGTSAGAYNSTLLVAESQRNGFGEAVRRLEEVWLQRLTATPVTCGNGVYRIRGYAPEYFNPFCLLTQPLQQASELIQDTGFLAVDSALRAMKAAGLKGPLASRLAEVASLEPFFDLDPFKKTIAETIDFRRIPQASRRISITATNWNTGKVRNYANDELTPESGCAAVMASSAIPGVFPPVDIGGHLFVDGGILTNTPLKPAIRLGADDLYVVYFDPDVDNIPVDVLSSTVDAFYRSLLIVWAAKINQDVATARVINRYLINLRRRFVGRGGEAELQRVMRVVHDRDGPAFRLLNIHLIHPKDDLSGYLGFLNFNRERIEGLIERGYQDAVEHKCDRSQCVMAHEE